MSWRFTGAFMMRQRAETASQAYKSSHVKISSLKIVQGKLHPLKNQTLICHPMGPADVPSVMLHHRTPPETAYVLIASGLAATANQILFCVPKPLTRSDQAVFIPTRIVIRCKHKVRSLMPDHWPLETCGFPVNPETSPRTNTGTNPSNGNPCPAFVTLP